MATGVVHGPRRTEMRAWQRVPLRVRRYILTPGKGGRVVYSGVGSRWPPYRDGVAAARGATAGNLGALEEEEVGGTLGTG